MDLFYVQFENEPENELGPFIVLVNWISLACGFIHQITILTEAFLHGKNERKLHKTLLEIQIIFKKELNYPIDVGAMHTKFHRYLIPFFALLTCWKFGEIAHSIVNHNKYVFVVVRIFNIIVECSRYMYIAAVLIILGDISNHLDVSLSKTKDELNDRIRYYRQVYAKIGMLMDLISDCFGWTLFAFLMRSAFDLINLMYYTYILFIVLKDRVLGAGERC